MNWVKGCSKGAERPETRGLLIVDQFFKGCFVTWFNVRACSNVARTNRGGEPETRPPPRLRVPIFMFSPCTGVTDRRMTDEGCQKFICVRSIAFTFRNLKRWGFEITTMGHFFRFEIALVVKDERIRGVV